MGTTRNVLYIAFKGPFTQIIFFIRFFILLDYFKFMQRFFHLLGSMYDTKFLFLWKYVNYTGTKDKVNNLK